jgi:DNA-binding NtrC family response regulator
MRHVLDRALSISKSDATALITGDSGTGKGVIARFIHERSTRKTLTLCQCQLCWIA